MTRHLDETALAILYHALGADLYQGINRFEAAFCEAEAAYRLDDIDVLLNLLFDPTLQDERRLVWHSYYSARKALLQWQPGEVEQIIDQVKIDSENMSTLQLRLELLRGQAHVMRGEWVTGVTILRRVARELQSVENMTLLADAEEWIARAFIGRAQSSGDWATPWRNGINAALRRALTIIQLPLFIPLLLYLWVAGSREFWHPILRYGVDYSNWPIFAYYLSALKALDRAQRVMSQTDQARALRLGIMRAELLRRLFATRA